MNFKETKCPECESELESQRDNEVKICHKCNLRWHFRDDDNSWRCYSTLSKAERIYNAIGEGYGFNGTKEEAIKVIEDILG